MLDLFSSSVVFVSFVASSFAFFALANEYGIGCDGEHRLPTPGIYVPHGRVGVDVYLVPP